MMLVFFQPDNILGVTRGGRARLKLAGCGTAKLLDEDKVHGLWSKSSISYFAPRPVHWKQHTPNHLLYVPSLTEIMFRWAISMPALVRALHATWLRRFEKTFALDLIPVFCSGVEQMEKVQLRCWHLLIWLRRCFLCEQRQTSLSRWLWSKEVARAKGRRSKTGLFSKPSICNWQHLESWA